VSDEVFLCYAWEDKSLADALRAAMESAGLTVFQDDAGMRDFDAIDERIGDALKSCLVLALYTPAFPPSPTAAGNSTWRCCAQGPSTARGPGPRRRAGSRRSDVANRIDRAVTVQGYWMQPMPSSIWRRATPIRSAGEHEFGDSCVRGRQRGRPGCC
jgi:hypothetical protein